MFSSRIASLFRIVFILTILSVGLVAGRPVVAQGTNTPDYAVTASLSPSPTAHESDPVTGLVTLTNVGGTDQMQSVGVGVVIHGGYAKFACQGPVSCSDQSGGQLSINYVISDAGLLPGETISIVMSDFGLDATLGSVTVEAYTFEHDWDFNLTNNSASASTTVIPDVYEAYRSIEIVADPRFPITGTLSPDPERGEVTIKIIESAVHGHLVVERNGDFVYTANDIWVDGDRFEFVTMASDGERTSVTVTIVFEIDPTVPVEGSVSVDGVESGTGNGGNSSGGVSPGDVRDDSPSDGQRQSAPSEDDDIPESDTCDRCN